MLPRMIRVKQRFERPRVEDVAAEVERQLATLQLGARVPETPANRDASPPRRRHVKAGETVAVTVGSRGVANIAVIAKAVCDHVRSLGGVPVIIPAMGSHGGATAEGQRQVIEEYGVTEQFTGAEIRSSMETVVVAHTPEGVPVHFDKNAFEADHVIVMGRVKPHTMFVGDIESGLHKMMLIGLGKHQGAWTYHKAIKEYSFDQIIRAVAAAVLEKCKVLCGVAIVENAYDETGLIEAVAGADFYEREKVLLRQAKKWLARLPFADVDLLIVDRIGKNISGTGMDANVIGRKYNDHVAMEGDEARVKRILIRSLTEQTHGNACGVGIAEFITQRALDQIDMESTRVNCITAGHPTAGMIPIVYPDDRQAIEAALQTIGLTPPEQARVIQIRDTLHLEEVLVSEAYSSEFAGRDDLERLGEAEEMAFAGNGTLRDI